MISSRLEPQAVTASGTEPSEAGLCGGNGMNACGGEILHIVQKDTQLTWLTQSDRSYGRKLMAMFSSRSVPNCVML